MGIGTGPSGQGHANGLRANPRPPAWPRYQIAIDFAHRRYRRADARRRHRRCEIASCSHGTAVVDAGGEDHRQGQEARRAFPRSLRERHRFHDGRFAIAGTDRSIDIVALDGQDPSDACASCPLDVPSSLDDAGASTSNKNTFPNGTPSLRDRDRTKRPVSRYPALHRGRRFRPRWSIR